MPTDTQFATDWLEERYRFDVAARNPSVEAACLQYFSKATDIRIIDIGAGSGANLVYLADKLPPLQHWALLDLNPKLLKAARTRIKNWGIAKGYEVSEHGDQISLERPARRIEVQLVHGSMLKLAKIFNLSSYHLATASAVLDLLTADMADQLLKTLHTHRLALLATLNYQQMEYFPREKADKRFIKQYEEHMQREQDFGRALGPACVAHLQQVYQNLPTGTFQMGPSRWQIEPSDQDMHLHLLHFLEKSLISLPANQQSPQALHEWLDRKRAFLQARQLRLTVEHQDCFAAPVYE